MKEYEVVQKTYVKSSNSTNLIISRYTYSLIVFTILTIIINLFLGNKELVISLCKGIALSLIITSVIAYIINIFNKKYDIKKIYTEDNTLFIALILGLFSVDINIYVLLVSIVVTLIIKNIFKKINTSSTIYGILIIILYKYFTDNLVTPLMIAKDLNFNIEFNEIIKYGGGIFNYLFGINYLSPVLSIVMFIYLFYKKGIKYNIVFSYIATITFIMLFYGLINGFNIWFVFFELISGSIVFMAVYLLTDYKVTPTTSEAQIIYGMILGIITSILRFIIPELSVVIALILGFIIFTNILDKISYKLKYNYKYYRLIFAINIIIMIITTIVLSVIY